MGFTRYGTHIKMYLGYLYVQTSSCLGNRYKLEDLNLQMGILRLRRECDLLKVIEHMRGRAATAESQARDFCAMCIT